MTAPVNEEWETASEEAGTRIVFDTIGDQWQGTYTGFEEIVFQNDKGEEKSFTQYSFRDGDNEKFTINGSYSLNKAFGKITPGDYVRITYVGDVPMGPGRNPLKDFRVDRRKK